MSAPLTLPARAVDVLDGRHEAEQIAGNINAAFWLHGHAPDTALFLLKQVHTDFAALAVALGYTIAPAVSEVAA